MLTMTNFLLGVGRTIATVKILQSSPSPSHSTKTEEEHP